MRLCNRKENEGDRHGSSKRSNATSVQRQKHDGSSSSSGESPFDSTETALYATVACEYAAYGCPYQVREVRVTAVAACACIAGINDIIAYTGTPV